MEKKCKHQKNNIFSIIVIDTFERINRMNNTFYYLYIIFLPFISLKSIIIKKTRENLVSTLPRLASEILICFEQFWLW